LNERFSGLKIIYITSPENNQERISEVK